MLTRLRHRTVGSRDDEDRAVHLSCAGDHVLDIVRMARAVDVRVVARRRLVLDVRRVDRDAALALLRSLVDVGVILERSLAAVRLGQDFRDGSRERRLAMVNVTDRSDVDMRLGSLKFFLSHCSDFLPYSPLFFATILSAIFLGTSS